MSAVPPSFLILSDIHFGAFAVTKDFALATNPPKHEMRGAVPMKEALITKVISTVKEHGAALS